MQSEEKETGSLGIDRRDVTVGEEQETRLMKVSITSLMKQFLKKIWAKLHFFLDKGKI